MADPIVATEDIKKCFGKIEALVGVSLEIEKGIIYGLLGPNGAGKTTLIRILSTLLKPDSGTARVAGIDVVADPPGVRAKIGFGGQYAAVDEFLTGRENLVMVGELFNLPSGEAKRRADELLERITLTDAADRQVKTYSGGMRRRLDLAASLVGRPEVLFLDEPTTGIDPKSRIDLWDLITDVVDAGTTLLLTTQYLDEADYLADRIGVIDYGRLIAEGTASELKALVGGEVVEIAVSEEQRATVLDAVRHVSSEEPLVDERNGNVCIPAPKGVATLVDAVRVLDDIGIEPHDIALREPTLDDVFLNLTGHIAEDETVVSARRRRGRSRQR
jgi:ABC-2 type transport system ATP-binding protein